jgi:STE24 endopeptidase
MIRMVTTISAMIFCFALIAAPALTQETSPGSITSPPAFTVPAAASAQPFDVKAAVDGYLATVPADKRAHSDAYFEGGYWLILWDFVVAALVMRLMLHFRWSARMRDLAERITRFRPLQTVIYGLQLIIAVSVLTFPWAVYESYFREHKYGLLNQTFGPWLQDQVIMLGINTLLGAFFLMLLFGVIRRTGKSWWIWGSVISVIFLAFRFSFSRCSTSTRNSQIHASRILFSAWRGPTAFRPPTSTNLMLRGSLTG